MGMFDYLRCHYPLPAEGAAALEYQTKDTPAQWLDQYEIRSDGTLWHKEYDTEDRSDPNAEGFSRLFGCATRVNERWEPVAMTGEVAFYANEFEFSAYFVGGALKHLETLKTPNVQAEGAAQDLSRRSLRAPGSACCESRLLKGTEVIKYRTSFNKIEALEVERETDKQVVLPANNGFRSSRENKVSDWSNWHDTWEAAHAFLVAKAERDVSSLRMRLEQAKGKLGQIKAMRSNG